MGLNENIAYARNLYETDPEKFRDLLTQLRAMEPMFKGALDAGLFNNATALMGPAPDREQLESWSVDIANVVSGVRRVMNEGSGGMLYTIILEDLKMVERCLQDAADKILELQREAGHSP